MNLVEVLANKAHKGPGKANISQNPHAFDDE